MLNDALYQSLRSAVRDGRARGGFAGNMVKVVNEGAEMKAKYRPSVRLGGIVEMKVLAPGEEYQVCCPFCNDTRYRLSINHRWNVHDPLTGSFNLHLIHCYNEECQSKYDKFHSQIRDRLKGYVRRAKVGLVHVAPGREPTPRVIRMPGPVTPLHELPPDHIARRYCLQRNHDPDLLGHEYGVGYCLSSSMAFADKRLVIPVFKDGLFAGWQARYLGEDGLGSVKGLFRCVDCGHQFRDLSNPKVENPAFAKKRVCPACNNMAVNPVPKYYTCPGMRKGHVMLNYDVARKWKFGVITEGPMDVLRVGTPDGPDRAGPAVCIFGHHMSPEQKNLANQAWGDGALFLLLDADAIRDQAYLLQSLTHTFTFARGVIPVGLPDNRDPDELDHTALWGLILAAARSKGVTLA